MSAEPGTSSVPSAPPRINKRLTREGAAYISNYVRHKNAYPSRKEKLDLLAALRSIPGNEMFTIERLNNFLHRHRPTPRPVLPDEESILFPKLTPTQLQQLRVLYRKRPEPPENIISFWAGRLKIDTDEVLAWVRYQQEKAKGEDILGATESPDIPLKQLVGDGESASLSPATSEFPRPHLPTPAKSLSPSISPQTRMPSLPPIVVKVEDRQCLSPDTPSLSNTRYTHVDEHSALEGLPPLTRHRPQVTLEAATRSPVSSPLSYLIPRPDSNTMLASTIRSTLRSNTSTEQAPSTVEEFSEKFQHIENMIDSFMKKYDSGQLEWLGWDQTLSEVAL